MTSPAYQWYPKDILGSQRVAMMDAKVECWYRRALDYCWLGESLPSDPKKLARVIGKGCTAKAAEEQIIPMFIVHPDDPEKLLHERQEQERAKQAEWTRKSSEGGKKSALARALKLQANGNQSSTTVEEKKEGWLPNGTNQKATLQSPSPSSTSSNDDGGGNSSPPPPIVPQGNVQPFLPHEENKALATGDRSKDGFVETHYRAGLKPDLLSRWLDAFHRQLNYDGVTLKQQKDYRKHFAGWIKFQPYREGNPDDFSPVKTEKTGPKQDLNDDYLVSRRKREEKTQRLSGH